MKTLLAISAMEISTSTAFSPSHRGTIVRKKYEYTEKNSTWNTELKATSPAAYSRSPRARSFHTITIAMQRASPIRISPVIYSGLSRSSRTASANISTGPTTQF